MHARTFKLISGFYFLLEDKKLRGHYHASEKIMFCIRIERNVILIKFCGLWDHLNLSEMQKNLTESDNQFYEVSFSSFLRNLHEKFSFIPPNPFKIFSIAKFCKKLCEIWDFRRPRIIISWNILQGYKNYRLISVINTCTYFVSSTQGTAMFLLKTRKVIINWEVFL